MAPGNVLRSAFNHSIRGNVPRALVSFVCCIKIISTHGDAIAKPVQFLQASIADYMFAIGIDHSNGLSSISRATTSAIKPIDQPIAQKLVTGKTNAIIQNIMDSRTSGGNICFKIRIPGYLLFGCRRAH